MADITQIQVGTTTYDINDSIARARSLPLGGSKDQILIKNSNLDYDTSWTTKESIGPSWGIISGTLNDQSDLVNILNTKANNIDISTIVSVTNEILVFSFDAFISSTT